MNLRHAAALAVVGWYLMIPPSGSDHKPDTNAPLSRWTIVVRGSFDTARQCDERHMKDVDGVDEFLKSHLRPIPTAAEQESIDAVSAEKCIATDDPRLMEK
jgi:hypothetical protein